MLRELPDQQGARLALERLDHLTGPLVERRAGLPRPRREVFERKRGNEIWRGVRDVAMRSLILDGVALNR